MTHLFVYGTLMKGQPNHYRMLDKANGKVEFLASVCTTRKFPLVIATKHNVPFLLNTPGQGNRVQGELYRVDHQMLRFLDDFEECPTLYQRTRIELEVKEWVGEVEGEKRLEPESVMKAYGYTKVPYPPDWLLLPTYERYNHSGDHGLIYVRKELRQ